MIADPKTPPLVGRWYYVFFGSLFAAALVMLAAFIATR